MDFKVIFRASFLHDLQQIVEFVAVHDPAAARKLGNTIVTKAEQLSFFPERHPKLRRRRGIRRFIVQKYFKIFYSIDQDGRTVDILRCWDGRRGIDPVVQR